MEADTTIWHWVGAEEMQMMPEGTNAMGKQEGNSRLMCPLLLCLACGCLAAFPSLEVLRWEEHQGSVLEWS